jgi:hypothetical protein
MASEQRLDEIALRLISQDYIRSPANRLYAPNGSEVRGLLFGYLPEQIAAAIGRLQRPLPDGRRSVPVGLVMHRPLAGIGK